ncbi:RNA-metabolising metallo-beta-lactamase [Staphylococcus coagulans]|uniref:RNA-metabolising metallo-beta-lactamase n=1 Tax=Staphylococcus schleiferi TaxID=1295 RepID=A0ABX0FWK2_STASC|nr:RNA-metabolising metallo-beta-lactamase [Staphylococcus schleiferi]NHB70431.1 RNA-metabolising metallo-beta-lactamase [Staphylococcus sp. 191]PNZ10009.1 RNA-metabolising metallo-beta-lactamase [Staphylococcus coagulans]RTX82172.1 RNA-metabolising metallo-beta-lactamase [Staphylococcus schleiferi subsp. schleiferi]NHA36088.1 RNA-metabolising metallo-beta-lactamase [Staphylococcus schleiferi]
MRISLFFFFTKFKILPPTQYIARPFYIHILL